MEKTLGTILVVDDEMIVRNLISDILHDSGYKVFSAEGGKEALAVVAKQNIELVITDKNMPGMDGITLIKNLKQTNPEILCLVITAYPSDESILAALQNDIYAYICKPFLAEDLQNTVKNALAFKRSSPNIHSNVDVQVRDWVELTAPSHDEFLSRFRHFFNLLNNSRLTEEEKLAINTGIEEIGRNAIEWGNKNNQQLRFALSYVFFGDRIVIKIEDEGEGYNVRDTLENTLGTEEMLQQRMAAGKRCGGFGLKMVRAVMDEVIFSERGNTVLMTKYLGGNKI
jgi:CheY-like chemotaxis protein/anti-sigma regulatory factor (Ser/Thr protein kinase)